MLLPIQIQEYPLSFVHVYPTKPTDLKIVYCLFFKVQVYNLYNLNIKKLMTREPNGIFRPFNDILFSYIGLWKRLDIGQVWESLAPRLLALDSCSHCLRPRSTNNCGLPVHKDLISRGNQWWHSLWTGSLFREGGNWITRRGISSPSSQTESLFTG